MFSEEWMKYWNMWKSQPATEADSSEFAGYKAKTTEDDMKCTDCTHIGLKRMIDSGPCQYHGDIPCLRCKRNKNDNDEFVAGSGLQPGIEKLGSWTLKNDLK